MLRPLTLIYLVLVGTSVMASAASFQGQTFFTAIPLVGQITITCEENGQRDWQQFTCRDLALTPFEFGHFNAEANTGATTADLSCRQAKGEVITKSMDYDSTKGQSASTVNLWINTVFQTGLLNLGLNTIDYKLMTGREVKAAGQFQVEVTKGADVQCPHWHEFSRSMHDCRSSVLACQIYFRRVSCL